MEPVEAFSQAFGDVQRALGTFLTRTKPGVFDPALTVLFAQIQAQLADDLRANLPPMDPFARERIILVTLQSFRKALSTAGLVDKTTSMTLAKDAIAKVSMRVQAQTDDQRYAEERHQAMLGLVAEDRTQWRWKARLDAYTCLFCISRNGQVFPSGIPMDSHPNCRCVPVPVDGRRMQSGDAFLKRLSAADRRRVMGNARATMYENGVYALTDLVDYNRRTAVPLRNLPVGGGR